MSKKTDPQITTNPNCEDFTEVTFFPDLSKFRMEKLDDDIISLFYKRVYDLSGVTPPTVQVELNGYRISCKTFTNYVDMYLKCSETEDLPKIEEKEKHKRWEVFCSMSDG